MAMNYTPLPDEFLEEMEELSDAEYGRLVRWAQKYHLTGEKDKLPGNERFYAKRIQMQIDRFSSAYQEKCDKARQSARMRWDANACDGMRDDADHAKPKPKPQTNSPDGESNKRTRFTPPTVDEVAAYCRERKNGIDAQSFTDYYARQGWKLSNGQSMKDWRAAVRTWEKRESEKPKKQQNYWGGIDTTPDPLVLRSIQKLMEEEGT